MNLPTDRIEKQIEVATDLDRVWSAITDFRQFGQWFRVALEGPFETGKKTRGRVTYPGYEHLTFEVAVVAITPKSYFAFRWHPYAVDPNVDYANEPPTLVEFFLEPRATGVLVRVTESGFSALPVHRRDEAFRMNTGGWEIQVNNIREYLHRA
ncbi:MAG: SRPBCC family protein [Phycisphaerales bacterium]